MIIKGGGRRITTATSRYVAPSEVTWPQPDRERQREDMAARVRQEVHRVMLRWSQEGCQCVEYLNAVARPERLIGVG